MDNTVPTNKSEMWSLKRRCMNAAGLMISFVEDMEWEESTWKAMAIGIKARASLNVELKEKFNIGDKLDYNKSQTQAILDLAVLAVFINTSVDDLMDAQEEFCDFEPNPPPLESLN